MPSLAGPQGGARDAAIAQGAVEEVAGLSAIEAERPGQAALPTGGGAEEDAGLHVDAAAVLEALRGDALGLHLELGGKAALREVHLQGGVVDLGRDQCVGRCAVLGRGVLQLEAGLVAQAGQLVGNVGFAKQEVIAVAHGDFVALQGLAE